MKHVLGIVGSPRQNGNTHILVSSILEGAKAAGAETDILLLKDLRIEECDGCHACWQGGPCSKKDDMAGVYEKILGSDAIVFGTPVYWYGPTALMKALIDRFVFFNCPENRARIKDKVVAIAVPFEEETLDTADLTVRLFEKSFQYLQMNLVGKVLVPGVTRRGEIKTKEAALEAARQLGGRLVQTPC